MASKLCELLTRARKMVPPMAAGQAVRKAAGELQVADSDRSAAQAALAQAMMEVSIGTGVSFHGAILDLALIIAGCNAEHGPADKKTNKRAARPAKKERQMAKGKKDATENAPKTGKYSIGDEFMTVATMGLQPTETDKGPACGYQFSRRLERQGIMDLPEGTKVRYVKAGLVYDGQAASKRMFFRIEAGTPIIIDSETRSLETDILVAGVVNHIDPDDAYNVQARANAARKQERARLKAAAEAAKKASAA